MTDDYREDLALFSRPQTTYLGETGRLPEQEPDDDEEEIDQSYQRSGGVATPRDQNGRDYQSAATNGVLDQGKTLTQITQTNIGGQDGGDNNEKPPEPYAIPPFDEMLGNVHEKAMAEAGFGRLQWVMFVILGLGLMGDAIELLMIAYVLPGAEKDLCMDDQMKGWLGPHPPMYTGGFNDTQGAIAFAGMVFGALIWGNLADKIGRKPTLITALSVNATFAIVGALVPAYWMFLLCRLLSGVGIGGSIPIVMAYYGEFCSREGRGWKIGVLLSFWALGGVYVSGIGWLIIPNREMFDLPGLTADSTFHSWRVFVLICLVPVIMSIIGLTAMPESPRYLLQVGRDLDALSVYRLIYKWNHTDPGAEYEMPEIELPAHTSVRNLHSEPTGCVAAVAAAFENFWNSFFQLFFAPLTITTLVLAATWFCTSFGYYGLSIWFPEYIKKLEQDIYFAQTNMTTDTFITNTNYELTTLDNLHFYNVTFLNVTFRNVRFRHVTFDICSVHNCSFLNATSGKTYFRDSIISETVFNYTDFYSYKFDTTILRNVTFDHLEKGCTVDFDINYSSRQIFLENFLCQVAVLPATLVVAVIMDRLGRVKVLVSCLLLAAISVFFIWFTDTEVAVVCMNAIFNCVIYGACNAIDTASMELYPTHLRATAIGLLSCLGRVAAILGNVAFGNFMAVYKAIPILLTAAILGLGALVALKLPESKDKLL